MNRFFSVAAVAAATLSLAPATASAQSRGYYSATPVTAPESNSIVTRTTVWKCGDGGVCVASKATSRDAIMCELVAREVGALSSFAVKGEAFDADSLAKCNARAK